MGLAHRALQIAVAASLAGCGSQSAPSGESGPATPPVKTSDYVASPALQQGSSELMFAIPKLGRFRASCTGPARGQISYKAATDAADQLVTTENRGFSSNGRVDPGQSIAVAIGRPRGPRVEWQVAQFSAGGVKVATASFAVAPLTGSPRGCFVSGKAEVAERQHSSGRKP
jgi:hypothetical protein